VAPDVLDDQAEIPQHLPDGVVVAELPEVGQALGEAGRRFVEAALLPVAVADRLEGLRLPAAVADLTADRQASVRVPTATTGSVS
jgi:hypothetical protein